MQQNPTGSSGGEFKLEIEGGMSSKHKLNCYLASPILMDISFADIKRVIKNTLYFFSSINIYANEEC